MHRWHINTTGSELGFESESVQTDLDKASQRMSQKDIHDANRASEVFENSPDLHDALEDVEHVMKFKDLNNTKLKITDDLVA